ncbi:MAG: FMN-binding negative transcriptional regulator [Dehalococcoidia bacterium]
MYTPPHNRQSDPDEVFAFMREFPFATLVTSGGAGLIATHIPLATVRDGDSLRVSGHIAKANPQAKDLAAGTEVLAVFASPHGYVSPSNYEPGNWVPTWNYVAVHAYGVPEVLETRKAKLEVLAATIAAHDAGFQAEFDAYPVEFVDAKLKGIVAFSFAVSRTDARWKLSQDRRPVERERVSLALKLSNDPSANRLAAYMEQQDPVSA